MRWVFSKPTMARMLSSGGVAKDRFLSGVQRDGLPDIDGLSVKALSVFVDKYLVPVLKDRTDTKKAYNAYCKYFGVSRTDGDAAHVVAFFDNGCQGALDHHMALGIFYRCLVTGIKIRPLKPVKFDKTMRPDRVDIEQWKSDVLDALSPVEKDKFRARILLHLPRLVTEFESTYNLTIEAAKSPGNSGLFEETLLSIDNVGSAWDFMKWSPATLAKYANSCYLTLDKSPWVEVR